MSSFSLWHWLIVLILLLVYVCPISKIIKKAGFSPWWSLVSMLPVINIVALWVFATVEWPSSVKITKI